MSSPVSFLAVVHCLRTLSLVAVDLVRLVVLANAQHHNLRMEMATGEQFFNWNKPRHHPIFAYLCDFAPEPHGGP